MRKPSRERGKVVVKCALQAMTLGFLLSAAVCRAQCAPPPVGQFASGNFELVGWNNKTVLTYGSPKGSSEDGSLIEGKTVNLVLSIVSGPGSFQPAGPGPGYGSVVFAYFNDDQSSYVPGAWWPVITFCNINIIDARDVGFSATATGGLSPNGEQLWFCFEGAGWDFMDILIIENASPPKQPSPPSPSSTSAAAFDPVSPVTPSTWIAGKEYPIVIKGTGFIVSDNGAGGCPRTVVQINVDAGSVDLTEVEVLDSTTINAKVKPRDTDPAENATIVLYGPDAEGGYCYNGTTGPNGQTTAQIIHPKLSITQLQYTNSQDVWRDDPGTTQTAMSKTVWPPLSPNIPSVFVSGDKIKVKATFNVSPPPPVEISGVRIEGSVAGLGLLVATGVNIPAGATSLPDVPLTADTAFPSSTTAHYPEQGVTWSYSQNGQPCSSNPSQCTAAGSTSSEVYVTLAQPSGLSESVMPLTAVKLAIGSGGATTHSAAFLNTWQQFEGPANVTGWDGRTLYYYEQGVGFNGCAFNTVGLLTQANGSGQCGSWAYLLKDALAINGIPSSFVTVTPVAGSWMLINNWSYSSSPTYPNNAPWTYQLILGLENGACCGMVPLPAGSVFGDLTSNVGLPGQNSPTPSEKAFNFHFIIKADGIPGIGGPYFDPSYGVTYADECDFESKAIAGYGEHITGEPANRLHVRKPFNGCSVTLVPQEEPIS